MNKRFSLGEGSDKLEGSKDPREGTADEADANGTDASGLVDKLYD